MRSGQDVVGQAGAVGATLDAVPIATHYSLQQVIGEGSYGTVYAARRLDDNASVVVKKIHMNLLSQSERSLAIQEARTLSHFNHANIIQYHEARFQDGVPQQALLPML